MSGGADKWNYEVNAAVVFGMYPELESASKEFDHRYKEIFSEFQNSPNKDRENLSKQLKTLSLEIGKEYGLSEGYYFNKITEAQLQRVTQRKSAAIKNTCSKDAEAHVDPLHIVMQGLIKKVSANDCIDLTQDFQLAETFF